MDVTGKLTETEWLRRVDQVSQQDPDVRNRWENIEAIANGHDAKAILFSENWYKDLAGKVGVFWTGLIEKFSPSKITAKAKVKLTASKELDDILKDYRNHNLYLPDRLPVASYNSDFGLFESPETKNHPAMVSSDTRTPVVLEATAGAHVVTAPVELPVTEITSSPMHVPALSQEWEKAIQGSINTRDGTAIRAALVAETPEAAIHLRPFAVPASGIHVTNSLAVESPYALPLGNMSQFPLPKISATTLPEKSTALMVPETGSALMLPEAKPSYNGMSSPYRQPITNLLKKIGAHEPTMLAAGPERLMLTTSAAPHPAAEAVEETVAHTVKASGFKNTVGSLLQKMAARPRSMIAVPAVIAAGGLLLPDQKPEGKSESKTSQEKDASWSMGKKAVVFGGGAVTSMAIANAIPPGPTRDWVGKAATRLLNAAGHTHI